MSEMIPVDESTFENEVLKANTPVLVDFGAVWCGPCKMLDPVVEELAGEWAGKAKVVKVDADTNTNLTIQYQVLGLPTLILFKNGQPAERVSGFQPKKKLIERFFPHLA